MTSTAQAPIRLRDNRRTRTLLLLVLAGAVLIVVLIAGHLALPLSQKTNLHAVNQAPSWEHLFGTDRLGRDVFARTLVGLRLSLLIGTVAALASAGIAMLLAAAAAGGIRTDAVVSWLVDLFLALPHLVLLILLSFAMGGGTLAVIIAVSLTHWPTLTRVLQAQARVVTNSEYMMTSRMLGTTRWRRARRHLVPHLFPHFAVGTVLLFPHAILHEAALSFLGLGVDASQPAIGILLSESMRALSAGIWWPALLPGVCLVILVKVVDSIGESLRVLMDPRSYHQ